MTQSKSPATPLRVGVVGLGVMGKNHARVLAVDVAGNVQEET